MLIYTKRLIDGTGAPAREAWIEVDEGRIGEVLATKPKGRSCDLDWGEYTVVPGLIDAHNHLGMNTGGDILEMALESDLDKDLRAARNARRSLAGGITTMRVCGEKNHMDLAWREASRKGLLPAPRLVVAGQMICPTSGHAAFYALATDGVEGARLSVRRQLAAGVDFIKMSVSGGLQTGYPGPLDAEFSPEEVHAIIHEAHRGGRKVAGHCFGGIGADVAVDAGIDSLEHGTLLTGAQLERMAARGTYLVVTPGPLVDDAEHAVAEIDRHLSREHLRVYPDVVRQARRAGVRLATGGDFVHGRPQVAMDLLLAGGLSPLEALSVICQGGADLLDRKHEVGTIEHGKMADLIALDKNPLEDERALDGVRAVLLGGIPAASEDRVA